MTSDEAPTIPATAAVPAPGAEAEAAPPAVATSDAPAPVPEAPVDPVLAPAETAQVGPTAIDPDVMAQAGFDNALLEATGATAETGAGKAVSRGSLIVLEGLDRSGKSTQVKLLAQRFVEAGRKAKVMQFPDRSTPIGKMIDAYLKSNANMDDHVIHLLFSANRWEAARTMTSLLESGTSVLCDRYYYSGVVYSAAKQNPALTLGWARQPDIGLPRPDMVLFLDLDEENTKERGGWGNELYEKAEMQKRVRELFHLLSQGGEEKTGGDVNMEGDGNARHKPFAQEQEDLVIVNAGADIEEVSEDIWSKVLPLLEARDKIQGSNGIRVVS
ncbi:hypothetical protein BROUX41_003023 [Berkeleyomyces rouxiae]|uniref:uncharacterized protein n=1 Tax=Berkeleyomyces rouxiae TaxID=2035830 RepID=UPI003B778539